METKKHKKFLTTSIIFLTFVSLFPVFFVRSQDFNGSLFWLYSTLMSLFLIFTYLATSRYKPMEDVGHRPTVSVVIPVKNEENYIKKTISRVLNSDYPKDKLDVIVVNDGSTDETAERVREMNSERVFLVQHDKNRGKRMAIASGVKWARGDIIVCIDSDSFVDRNAIKFLVQPFVDEETVAVCGHGNAYNQNKNLLTKLQHFWYQEMFRNLKGMEAKLGCVTCCSGILAAYRKSVILPVMDEWLNEKFLGKPIFLGDDRQLTNLALRGLTGHVGTLQSDGGTQATKAIPIKKSKVTYQSNAVVYTVVPDNMKQFMKQQLRWKRAWVHGSLLAGKFMWKKPFPVPLYFYVYQFLTYVNPIITITWLLLKPFGGEWIGALAFLAGSLYTGFLHGLNTWRFTNLNSNSITYRIFFVFMSIFFSISVLPYAWATVWKGGWVTRSGKNEGKN